MPLVFCDEVADGFAASASDGRLAGTPDMMGAAMTVLVERGARTGAGVLATLEVKSLVTGTGELVGVVCVSSLGLIALTSCVAITS